MKSLPRMALALLVSAWPLSHAVAQQLQCSPSSHDYGQVQIGTSTQYVFQLSNTGSRALSISSKGKSSAEFRFSKFNLPITLQPGQSTRMAVNFVPSASGTITGTLTLHSNAKNPTLSVGVSGTGVAAKTATLGVSPTSLNFGNVTVGSPSSLPLTLSASNGTVTISSAQVNSSEFTISGLGLPKTIATGQSVTATITFTPNASGTATANLTLISDAVNSPTTVPLTGVGVAVKAHSADLTWTASQDVVIGYNIYRGSTKGGPYTKINTVLDATTSYTDNTVSAGATYYYVATSVDSNNVESAYSNEVRVVIPAP
ncbi:MAG TPA: choice-of-anchor D domain-containing protein [Terriglobales bacterium]|jgi:polyisoprenoid-binding protein YceI|nr:choice-of-anchor D domain-containing protein [Terriglobales bacterium]